MLSCCTRDQHIDQVLSPQWHWSVVLPISVRGWGEVITKDPGVSGDLGDSTIHWLNRPVAKTGQVKALTILPPSTFVSICFITLFFFFLFFLTRAAAAVKEFTGTPWYFPTFWGCFLSVDLQPCRFSALSASELCLWPLAVTVDTEESQLNVSVFVSAGSGRLINPSGKHSFRPNPYAFVPWK